jgi:hypothetical protein
MNLKTTIQSLRAEADRISRVIQELENLQTGKSQIKSRRGRKFMGMAERKAVAERMRRYWASRRKDKVG